MGIRVSCNTKAKASLKLANSLRSYLFEQEYGELSNCSTTQIGKLREALKVLDTIVSNNK